MRVQWNGLRLRRSVCEQDTYTQQGGQSWVYSVYCRLSSISCQKNRSSSRSLQHCWPVTPACFRSASSTRRFGWVSDLQRRWVMIGSVEGGRWLIRRRRIMKPSGSWGRNKFSLWVFKIWGHCLEILLDHCGKNSNSFTDEFSIFYSTKWRKNYNFCGGELLWEGHQLEKWATAFLLISNY